MPVSFGQIPNDVLLPLFYAEIVAAPEPIQPALTICLVGSANQGPGYDEGTHTPNMPHLLTGDNAKELFGRGSMLWRMYEFCRSNAPFAEIWGVAVPSNLDDPNTLNQPFRATAKIKVVKGGSKTFFGTGVIFVEGIACQFSVQKTDTPATIATRLRAALNDQPHACVASYDPEDATKTTILLTCRYPGAVGDWIRVSHVGCRGRSTLHEAPVKIGRTCLRITKGMGGGSGENSPTACFAMLQDRPFDVFVYGYFGDPFWFRAEDFMDHASGRWAPNRQMYGHAFTGSPPTPLSRQIELFDMMDDPHMSVVSFKQSVIPPWLFASALGGVAATHWSGPPELSRPLQTLELRNCCVGDEDNESWSRLEKTALLRRGATTFTVQDDYSCRIDRVRTTRKKNLWGDTDWAWADAITMFQAQYFVRSMRSRIRGAYPRCALSTLPTGINGFTSPVEIRSLVIHEYKRLASVGLVENVDLFSRYLVVERNPFDRNRVDVLMRPDFVNQLRVVAALVETHLELDATDPTLIAQAA